MRWHTFIGCGRIFTALTLVIAGTTLGHADQDVDLTASDMSELVQESEPQESSTDGTAKGIARTSFSMALQSDCDACVACDGDACDSKCGPPKCCDPCLAPCLLPRSCVTPCWAHHRTGGFGEFLYLFPGSTDLVYAVEQTDPALVAATSPTGPVGISSVKSQPGFRVGFSVACSPCSSVLASYTRWDGDDNDVITRTAGTTFVLNSRFLHPSNGTIGSGSVQSAALQDQHFQFADVGYRHLWRATDVTALNWQLGFRYGNMEQQFTGAQTVGVGTGLNTVNTDIDFDGYGLTGGFDFERYSKVSGLLIYGKGLGSLLAGDWTGTYAQTNQFGGGVIASRFEDTRMTPILELEAGLGWQSKEGRIRVSSGYMSSFWLDALSTRTYLDAVRSGNMTDVSETITFSGLVTRVEVNF